MGSMKGRLFTRPMPPTGRMEERTDRLWRDMLRMMDEAERDRAALEARLTALENRLREGETTK